MVYFLANGCIVYGAENFLVKWKSYVVLPDTSKHNNRVKMMHEELATNEKQIKHHSGFRHDRSTK